uniref:Putative ribonuclease H-like domain-containing protein n=1 Tax=Helianthus annuus TaxID=4232 RepID=A0A251UJX2_HELAN
MNRIMILVNQLRMNEENITEQRVVEKILRSLTRKYEAVMVAIEESKDLTTISTEELLGILQSHELRLKQYDDNPMEQAFQMQINNTKRSRQNRYDMPVEDEVEEEEGHTARFCQQKEENDRNGSALLHEEETEGKSDDTMFMIFNIEEVIKDDCWYLDSGCSNHMTGNKNLFITLNESERREVRTGDNKKLEVLGCGDVLIKVKGVEKKVPNVFYVEGLKHNLLSVGQLVKKGYQVNFANQECMIKDSSGACIGLVKMTGNKMFPLNLSHDVTPRVCNIMTQDVCVLWHRRYGHLNFDMLHNMGTYEIVKGLPKIPKTTNSIYEDRGGEYCGHEFQNYLKENGIHHQLTTSYTPQQNGVAERKNGTLMELSRSMLKMKNMSHSYWAEAVACATYLINRAITKSIPNITPQEAWSGRKPSVRHLKVFGCVAYAHVPKQHRGKLDDKVEKTIFIGYSENSKAYKLYNPITGKTIISRDVVFDEEQEWNEGTVREETSCVELNDSGEEDQQPDVAVPGVNEEPIVNNQNENYSSDEEAENSNNQHEEVESSSSSENEELRTRKVAEIYQHEELYERGQTVQNDVADFVLYADVDPITYNEVFKYIKWREAMDREIQSILKNGTWDIVDPPKGQKPIGVKWIYKTKYDEHGNVSKHKARLVAKGYNQKYGIDYQDVFAHVIRFDTIRLVLALVAQHGWHLHQMDVKMAFLNGNLKEQVYIDQPEGYVKKGEERKVCHLKKALYGLKQAPRAWYIRIDEYFRSHGFKKCIYEHTLFTKISKHSRIIICLYVDDLILASDSLNMIEELKESMKCEFEMTDLGNLHYFLGMEVNYDNGNIMPSQQKYARNLLEKFKMENCHALSTPMEYGLKLSKEDPGDEVDQNIYRSLVGCLMYLTNTRPDILFAVNKLTQFMERPKKSHWEARKRILRYIKGTTNHGIIYSKGSKGKLVGFSDSDYAGSIDDSKSTSGYVFHLGSGAVAWQSKKQKVVALSSTEAEYIALSQAGCQALWLKGILNELQINAECPPTILCDNKSTISSAKDPVYHGKSKYIRIKYHFIRDLIKNDEVEVRFCTTKEQAADILTKALQLKDFKCLKEVLHVVSI